MKVVVRALSESQRQALADFYERPSFKVLKRLVELERVELAKDSMANWRSTEPEKAFLAGQAEGLKRLVKTIEDNYKEVNQKD